MRCVYVYYICMFFWTVSPWLSSRLLVCSDRGVLSLVRLQRSRRHVPCVGSWTMLYCGVPRRPGTALATALKENVHYSKCALQQSNDTRQAGKVKGRLAAMDPYNEEFRDPFVILGCGHLLYEDSLRLLLLLRNGSLNLVSI